MTPHHPPMDPPGVFASALQAPPSAVAAHRREAVVGPPLELSRRASVAQLALAEDLEVCSADLVAVKKRSSQLWQASLAATHPS